MQTFLRRYPQFRSSLGRVSTFPSVGSPPVGAEILGALDVALNALLASGTGISGDRTGALTVTLGALTLHASNVLEALTSGDLTTALAKWLATVEPDVNTHIRSRLATFYGTAADEDITTLLTRFLRRQ